MSTQYEFWTSVLLLATAMSISFATILFLKLLKGQFTKRGKNVAFNKNIAIVLRLNSFFIGAVGIDMIVSGITGLYGS